MLNLPFGFCVRSKFVSGRNGSELKHDTNQTGECRRIADDAGVESRLSITCSLPLFRKFTVTGWRTVDLQILHNWFLHSNFFYIHFFTGIYEDRMILQLYSFGKFYILIVIVNKMTCVSYPYVADNKHMARERTGEKCRREDITTNIQLNINFHINNYLYICFYK